MTELTKAQIASKAQAEAHKRLRREHPAKYAEAYQAAKQELTEQAAKTDEK